MRLKFENPICFFDIESTGTDRENDRIVELAICKLFPNGDREVKVRRFNPERPIPIKASEVHGITDEAVANEPTFKQCAKAVAAYIQGCDLGGYNSNAFDIPMLQAEFFRAGIHIDLSKTRFIDAGNIFKIQEPRTLTAAYKFYCGQELEDAHSAEADILATVDVFAAQLDRYKEVPDNMDELHLYCNYGKPFVDISGKFTTDDEGRICFNFGKHKGEPAIDHPGFVEWMLTKADFPYDTRKVCESILQDYYSK